MKKFCSHIYVLIFLLGCSKAFSQDNLKVTNYNASTEFKQNVVFDMAFDEDGYLWIISVQGLLERYDGRGISIMNEELPNLKKKVFVSIFNIPGSEKTFSRTIDGALYEIKNALPRLYADPAKNYQSNPSLDGYYPTEKAMQFFNLQKNRPTNQFGVGLKNNPIAALNKTDFAVLGNDPRKIQFYNSESKIGELSLNQGIENLFLLGDQPMALDSLHNLYLIDNNGQHLKPQRIMLDSSMGAHVPMSAISFFADRHHNLVFAEYKKSIYELKQNDGGMGYILQKKISTTNDLRHVTAIMYEPISNKYFVGTIENGFYVYLKPKIQTIKINDKLPMSYPYMESLLYCLHNIGDNTVITTTGVALEEENNEIRVARRLKTVNYCGVITSKGKDTLYTTYNNQIKYAIKSMGYKEGIINTSLNFTKDHVKIILPEGDSLWVFGGSKFINIKNNKINLLHDNHLPPDIRIGSWPLFALRSSDGVLWVCHSKAVLKINTENGIAIDTVKELNNSEAIHIYEYKKILIFSSSTTGLYFYDHRNYYHLPLYLEDGRPVVSWSSYVDSNGFLWVSTENGLYEAPFKEVLESTISQKPVFFYRYGNEDGITNTEFNGGATCNYAVTKDERLYYPSEGGVVTFKARELFPSFYNKAVFIEKLRLDNKVVELNSHELDLPNNISELLFRLTTAYYQDYHNLDISYRLDSGEWKNIDASKADMEIKIFKPSSGQHSLLIRKRIGFRLNDFIYSKYEIHVQAGLLEKWWFWLLMIGALYLLLIIYSNFRNEAILEREKKLELQVSIQTQELKKELETKEVLLSIITHDMITPLKYVSFISDILRKGKETEKEKISQALDDIKETSDNLLSQSQNIVNWIKYTSKRLSVTKTNLQLDELVDSMFKLFAPMAKEKNVALVNNIPSKTIVFSDRNILSIILNNLISNALKHCHEGKIELGCMQKAGKCNITISDSGLGINEHNLTGINSLLAGQKDSNEYFEDGKSGIGYMIIAELAKVSQINVEVESSIDFGTKVHLYL
ncbi:MAG: HAMP domain-containing histidine kinase [Bacteroidetes bacterium]|nr:HAMP domain-containing histidine kinase [Bacteroidota bacterium]